MKKYRVLVITILITFIILFGGLYIIKMGSEPVKSYNLSSYIKISNSEGVVNNSQAKYEDFENKSGNCELKIKIGSHEQRVVKYEVSILVNYEQQYFKIEGKRELSTIVEVNDNSQEFIIEIDRSAFTQYRNHLIINIRQDIGQLSFQNNLVTNSDTLNLRYDVINEEINNKKKLKIKQLDEFTNQRVEKIDETVFEIASIQAKDYLIQSERGKDLALKLTLGSSHIDECIVWGYLNSRQVKINGVSYFGIKLEKNLVKNTTLHINTPSESGIYELEIYCVPNPYKKVGNAFYDIISAERYTLKVE